MVRTILSSPLWSGISAVVAIVALYFSIIGLPPNKEAVKEVACSKIFGKSTTLNEQYTDTGNNNSQSWPLIITNVRGSNKSGEFSGWFYKNPSSGDGWSVSGTYEGHQYEVTHTSVNNDIVIGNGACVDGVAEGVKWYTKKVNNTPYNRYTVKIR